MPFNASVGLRQQLATLLKMRCDRSEHQGANRSINHVPDFGVLEISQIFRRCPKFLSEIFKEFLRFLRLFKKFRFFKVFSLFEIFKDFQGFVFEHLSKNLRRNVERFLEILCRSLRFQDFS